jgi:hypothetical protein
MHQQYIDQHADYVKFANAQKLAWNKNAMIKTKLHEIFELMRDIPQHIQTMGVHNDKLDKEFDEAIKTAIFTVDPVEIEQKFNRMSSPMLHGILEHMDDVKAIAQKVLLGRV